MDQSAPSPHNTPSGTDSTPIPGPPGPAASVTSGGSASTGGHWGTMGGAPGDGFVGSNAPVSGGDTYGGGPPPEHANTLTPSYMPSTPSNMPQSNMPTQQPQQQYTPGSITRFATPDMQVQYQQQPAMNGSNMGSSSYAARSAQAHANYQSPQHTVQPQYGSGMPQQAYQTPTGVGGGGQGMSAGTPSSYAARSAQAYATTGTPMNTPTSVPGTSQPNPSSSSSFAARSAQAYANQQQPQPSSAGPYAARSAQSYAAASPGYQTPQQHQQPPPQAVGASSYAARSAQAHATSTMQTPPVGSMPTPTMQNAGGSYADRSVQAQSQQQSMYGSGMPPQPPQQQPPSANNYQYPQQPGAGSVAGTTTSVAKPGQETPQVQAQQQRFLTDATRKVQEHAYYMRQAMDQKNLPVVLDRAAHMVGELGGPPHGHHHSSGSNGPSNTGLSAKLNPKNYYELYMRALEDMPTFEDYLYNLVKQPLTPADSIQIVESRHSAVRMAPYTMRELYSCTQYCPRVVSRLYLQISAGSALIRSGEVGAKWVLNELAQAVRCEQNPIRGLFLRHFLLTALRDKLPDTPAPMPGAPDLETIQSEEELEAKSEDSVGEKDPGTVKDSYEFVLGNFMEMNKLWVRIQHLPGEGNNKDVRKRRERERNELRILVGTNLVRLSQLECVTSKIYGEIILPQILDHIVEQGDPLSQAYLMDCLVQVFPDEYHIETLPILLNVCPRLRDKVNIRTILQGLMDRLANYLAEEELLDESDTNQVKKALARDSFGLFEECVQKVYNARGPKLTSKEVIRLQTALLQFSLKCYPGNMNQISRCIAVCVSALRQANASYDVQDGAVTQAPNDNVMIKALDEASVVELEKLLSIPLDSLALKVLKLDHYGDLISFLPWASRKEVALKMLQAIDNVGSTPGSMKEIEELFSVIQPVLRDENAAFDESLGEDLTAKATSLMAGLGVNRQSPQTSFMSNEVGGHIGQADVSRETILVSKLVHLLDHQDLDVLFEMLKVARTQICRGGPQRYGGTLVAVVFASIKLIHRIRGHSEEAAAPAESKTEDNAEAGKKSDAGEEKVVADAANGEEEKAAEGTDDPNRESKPEPTTSCRQVFVFVQETLALVSKAVPETGMKLYLEISLTADSLASAEGDTEILAEFAPIAYELLSQAFAIYEEAITDSKAQQRCIKQIVGTLLASRSLSKDDYESLITKTAQFSAKVVKKPDQCELVSLCAHLFYPTMTPLSSKYSNPQRALECLQRSLKLADACTSANASNVQLFVDLLEQYVFFFEKKNPLITHNYVTGLVALIREHLNNLESHGIDPRVVADARGQFSEVIRHIKRKKTDEATSELFSPIQVDVGSS